MDISAVRAFDKLLRNGADIRQIDEFLSTLGVPEEGSYEQALLYFSEGGKFRDQLPFLKELCRTGMYIERCDSSRVAFIFFTAIIDPMGVTAARARISQLGANCIWVSKVPETPTRLSLVPVPAVAPIRRPYRPQWRVVYDVTIP